MKHDDAFDAWVNTTVVALLCTAAISVAFIVVTQIEKKEVQPSQAVLPTVTPQPPRPANQWANAPCGCSYDAYNCEDFKDAEGNRSQEGAQICYNYCMDQVAYDVHKLVVDRPDDVYVLSGWACIDEER